MYEFQMRFNTDLIFKKLSEGSYLIGTRKVAAKVTNGILLVRVGGGFMDIESFFKQYGEQELAKQHRQEERDLQKGQDVRMSVDTLQSAKSAASKLKKGLKSGGRNSTAQANRSGAPTPMNKTAQQSHDVSKNSSSMMSSSVKDDADSQTQPGEYEIDLGDDNE